jgi:hypothetical protein
VFTCLGWGTVVESATFPNTFCSSGGVRNIGTSRSSDSEQFIICLACVRIGKGRLIEGSSGGVECLFDNITRSSTQALTLGIILLKKWIFLAWRLQPGLQSNSCIAASLRLPYGRGEKLILFMGR